MTYVESCPYSDRLTCDDQFNCKDCFVYMFMQDKDDKVNKARNYNDER